VGHRAAAGMADLFAGSLVLSRFAAALRHRALKDAGVLRTVLDARAYVLAPSKDRELRPQWQRGRV